MHADSIRVHGGPRFVQRPSPERYRSPLQALFQLVFLCGLISLPVVALFVGLRGALGLP